MICFLWSSILLASEGQDFKPQEVEELGPKPAPIPDFEMPDPATLEGQGALLYRQAGCVGCHSPPGVNSEHLGGGREMPTAFGTFYASNISGRVGNLGIR